MSIDKNYSLYINNDASLRWEMAKWQEKTNTAQKSSEKPVTRCYTLKAEPVTRPEASCYTGFDAWRTVGK